MFPGGIVRPAEVRSAEVRPDEVRIAEVRIAEVRPAEVRPDEVRIAEVRPAEVWIDCQALFTPGVPGSHPLHKLSDVILVSYVRSPPLTVVWGRGWGGSSA